MPEPGAILFHVNLTDIRPETHEMPGAGIKEPSVIVPYQFLDVQHLEAYGKSISATPGDAGRMQPVLSLEKENSPVGPYSQPVCKGGYAPTAVSAHHTPGTVGIEILHTEVGTQAVSGGFGSV